MASSVASASAASAVAKPPSTTLPPRTFNYNTSHSSLSFRLPNKPKLRIFTRVCANSNSFSFFFSIFNLNFYLISPNCRHFTWRVSDLRFSCTKEFLGWFWLSLGVIWFCDLERIWKSVFGGFFWMEFLDCFVVIWSSKAILKSERDVDLVLIGYM